MLGRCCRAANGLEPGRPLVWLDELPWHEFAGPELALACESALAREVEETLRRIVYRWRHFQADMVVEPFFRLGQAFDETGIGVSVAEDTFATDPGNAVVSHRYYDQLPDEAALAKTRETAITARPDIDAAAVPARAAGGVSFSILLYPLVSSYILWCSLAFVPSRRGVFTSPRGRR
jgi:hypothetical protein